MKTRIFNNPVKFAQSVKVKVDGEYVSLLELLQNADIELDETPTSGSDKAVSSGGVYSALQEKQGQISITTNDDGSVDINIPDAGEVSSSGVTFIDVSTITETIDEGNLVLDLSKNGKYILTNNNNIETPLRLNFSSYTFIIRDQMYINSIEDYIGGAVYLDGDLCYLWVSLERLNSQQAIFIKVEDNLATLTCRWEF